jgi:hypothetical protein
VNRFPIFIGCGQREDSGVKSEIYRRKTGEVEKEGNLKRRGIDTNG